MVEEYMKQIETRRNEKKLLKKVQGSRNYTCVCTPRKSKFKIIICVLYVYRLEVIHLLFLVF